MFSGCWQVVGLGQRAEGGENWDWEGSLEN